MTTPAMRLTRGALARSRRALATAVVPGALLVGAALVGGCLDKPGIEELWTRVDVRGSNMTPGQPLPAGNPAIALNTAITYRAVVTGFAVAELRSSDSLAAAVMNVAPDAPRLTMAENIDFILQHSTSLGRSVQAVTGWDHLIQPVNFSFTANAPTAGSRLFLLCYLGSGVRLELPSGADSIVVTPFVSSQHQVLPVGMELAGAGTGAP